MPGAGIDDPCFVASTVMVNAEIVLGLFALAGTFFAIRELLAWEKLRVVEPYLVHHKLAINANDLIGAGADFGLDFQSIWRYGLYYVASAWKKNNGKATSVEKTLRNAGVDEGGMAPTEELRRRNMAINGDRNLPISRVDLNS